VRATRAPHLVQADAAFVAATRLRAARLEPYLASAIFALIPVPTPGLGTFAVDRHWRLYLDLDQARSWGVEASAAVMLHEAHHVVREHARRAVSVGVTEEQFRLWNLATDAAINDDLVADGMPLPHPVLPSTLGLNSRGTEESYFAALKAEAAFLTSEQQADAPQCGSGSGGARLAQELTQDDVPVVDGLDADAVRRDVAHAVVEATKNGDQVSPGLARWAQTLLQPQVPWQRILRSVLGRPLHAAAAIAEPTWQRPDRRNDAHPDILRPGARRTLPEVAVVIDTSASMSQSLLNAAITEVDSILRRSGANLTVVVCDAVAARPQRVSHIGQLRLAGGGGTDMRVGIAAAAALRPAPRLIAVLTDGLTQWPAAAPSGASLVAVVIDSAVQLPSGPGITSVRIQDQK